MGTTQRIRTEIGINKRIDIELEQDFDFLEILSLKIQQEEQNRTQLVENLWKMYPMDPNFTSQ